MAKKRRAKKWLAPLVLVGLVVIAGLWFFDALGAPAGKGQGKKEFIRYENASRLSVVLRDLEKRGLLKNALATRLLAMLQHRPATVIAGSYSLSPSVSAQEILRQLAKPVNLILRLPETNWANRTAHLLANHDIVNADEYMRLVKDPKEFSKDVSFPLPKDSLEGYLYPKKYELPPLFGARRVIEMQLKEFERTVWDSSDRPKDMHRTLTLASLVQLEAGVDDDRPMIAGVIENRIKKKMPLQIDSSLLYGIQKWRRLTYKDYKTIDSPYNTYKYKGLPPGPICSPDAKDIEAAMHPAKHNYLYYVALPNGRSIYAATYKEHLKNIGLRKAAIAALKGAKS